MVKPITLSAEVYVDAKQGTSCDYHRIILPYGRLFAETKVPVIVFNRLHSRGIGFLQRAKASGAKIIADLDDLPELDSSHYLFDKYCANGTSKNILESVQMADIVSVTNIRLADEMMQLGVPRNKIAIVPNALPFDQGQFVRNASHQDELALIYAAGASHYRDARILPVGLPHLTFAGFEQGHPEWEKIRVLHPYAGYKKAASLDSYMHLYEGHKVALAPLRPSRFNACKSNLKMLEAGARGLPLIASEVDPYIDAIDRKVVLYAPTRGHWGALSARLIQDRSLREDWGDRLAQHVRENYQLERANKVRKQLIEALQ